MKTETTENPSIIFYGVAPDTSEVMRISKDGFYYKGERIDDIHNVYERFNEWLSQAEHNYEK